MNVTEVLICFADPRIKVVKDEAWKSAFNQAHDKLQVNKDKAEAR